MKFCKGEENAFNVIKYTLAQTVLYRTNKAHFVGRHGSPCDLAWNGDKQSFMHVLNRFEWVINHRSQCDVQHQIAFVARHW